MLMDMDRFAIGFEILASKFLLHDSLVLYVCVCLNCNQIHILFQLSFLGKARCKCSRDVKMSKKGVAAF